MAPPSWGRRDGRGGSERHGRHLGSQTESYGHCLVLPKPEQNSRPHGLCWGLTWSGRVCLPLTWARGPSESPQWGHGECEGEGCPWQWPGVWDPSSVLHAQYVSGLGFSVRSQAWLGAELRQEGRKASRRQTFNPPQVCSQSLERGQGHRASQGQGSQAQQPGQAWTEVLHLLQRVRGLSQLSPSRCLSVCQPHAATCSLTTLSPPTPPTSSPSFPLQGLPSVSVTLGGASCPTGAPTQSNGPAGACRRSGWCPEQGKSIRKNSNPVSKSLIQSSSLPKWNTTGQSQLGCSLENDSVSWRLCREGVTSTAQGTVRLATTQGVLTWGKHRPLLPQQSSAAQVCSQRDRAVSRLRGPDPWGSGRHPNPGSFRLSTLGATEEQD